MLGVLGNYGGGLIGVGFSVCLAYVLGAYFIKV
jgi:hypothetical protein